MNVLRLLYFSLLALPLLRQPVAAQALDPTFTPPTSLYTSGTVYSMAAQQADGKRVVAGSFTRVNNTAVGSLIRLDAAGALDATFAQNVGGARNTFRVKALPNGQYLVSGFYNEVIMAGGLTRPALLRLNASGTADAAFNAGTGPASNGPDGVQLNTFVGQPDGKVVVGGTFTSFSGQNVSGLVRLTATGALDAAFNANLGTGFNGPVYTVAVQPDGKLLVGGTFTALNGQPAAALLRLQADGTRDVTFTSAVAVNSYVGKLLLQPDGKVLATGYLNFGATTAGLARFTATGSLDTSFAAPSASTSYASSYYDANAQLQPDGKVILAVNPTAGTAAYITRLNANGTLDPSFSVSNGLSQYPYSIGLQSDGSLWVGGSFYAFNGQETPLGRLTSTGAADATFLPKIQAAGNVTAVARQADGQLLVAGNFTEYSGVAVRRLVRLSATGTLDAAYVAATTPIAAQVTALALQPDGKLLVGTTGGLRRVLTTGAPDASYGTFAATAYIMALATQPDGRTVVAGHLNLPSSSPIDPNLMRLTAAGDYDTSFNPGTTNAPGPIFYLLSLALQPDGKVLVGGSYLPASGSPALRVVRYQSTGAVDASFTNSTAFTLGTNATSYVVRLNALAVQPDGKVVVGGYFTTVDGMARANLARLTATGQLDAGFVPPATSPGAVTALALQPNGCLLVGSGFGNDGTPATTPLLRVLDTGALDPSFGTTATPDNAVAALLVQPNGAIVVAGGFATVGGATSPGIARITAPNVLAVAASAAVAARTEVWPVPAHTQLHVAPDARAHPQALALLDALGRVVRSLPVATAADFTLEVAGLPAGLYLLRVQYAAGAVTRQVAIQ